MNERRNKGIHKYRESKTSIDEGTFAVFNRFREKSKLPLQKMVGNKIYDGLHELVKNGKIKRIRKLLNKVSHPPVDLRTEKEFLIGQRYTLPAYAAMKKLFNSFLDIKQIKI